MKRIVGKKNLAINTWVRCPNGSRDWGVLAYRTGSVVGGSRNANLQCERGMMIKVMLGKEI